MKRTSAEPRPYDDTSKVCLVERNTCPSGIPLVNPAKVGKRQANDLVELALEIQQADTFVNATTCNKLQVIVQQVRYLKEQAHQILQDAERNANLHRVACNFSKVPGSIYHLYERPSGQKYFSMLAPEEWTSPHPYHGSYRLEADQSWTKTEDIVKMDFNMHEIRALMQSRNPLTFPKIESIPMDV